ncbi:GGDEF domain-containing protein [Bradyrhizobium sp. UFLA03-84]|uniref:GGDEF domain-containing protein n=1 Tax=Bradyrhizobium sp. UFLA03-84 TaxID=418599 RepID=UPI000BADDE2E|nr:GGDEF domain-containing protein [Bradyrhizobium sp. UFLA03-84]PAY03837.1 GGDEF domain-containing protein [Bradyrhizobium sp. UFLA03-84]
MAQALTEVLVPAEAAKDAVKRARQRRPIYLAQAISFVLDSAILGLYHLAGTTEGWVGAAYVSAGIGWTALMLAASELHLTDRFRDHYLTVPQSFGSISIQLMAIYLAPEIGFYFVSILFIILSFGALRMTAKQTGAVWTFAAVGLTTLFVCTDRPIAMPMAPPAERQLALLCFLTALGRCAFTGLYGSSLREMLYRRGNQLKEAHARIEELAQIDELTGVLNRRYVMRALSEEILRAQRGGTPCSVAIIDLDFFKRINDRYGHPVGDEVLRSFAISVAANIRMVDKLGRYGGEEFLLVLPGAPRDDAIHAVDRIRQIIGEMNWDAIGDRLKVNMSAGVSEVRRNEAPDEVLARADLALYRAKNAGRNRVSA